MTDSRVEQYAKLLVETCVDVQPGWGVVTSPWLTHHDARWWPEPERFRPERWSEPARDAGEGSPAGVPCQVAGLRPRRVPKTRR